jgi:integrase
VVRRGPAPALHPRRGPRGHEARTEILKLIKETRRRGEDLPSYDDLRQRHARGAAFKTGLTGDYLLAWLAGKRDLKPSAHATCASHIRTHLYPHLKDIELDKLRVSDINAMFTAINERSERIRQGLERGKITGVATQHRVLATLSNALNDAMRQGLISFNPARLVTLAPEKRSKARVWTDARVEAWRATCAREVERTIEASPIGHVNIFKIWRQTDLRPSPVMVWTPEQTGAFLDQATRHRLYALYHLVAFTGLRRGEACGAEVKDLDLDAAELLVQVNRVQVGSDIEEGEPKTASSAEPVALDEGTVTALRAHLKRQKEERLQWGEAWVDSGKIFTKENGEALYPATVTDTFERIAFDAGLPPIRLHDLRHGAATMGLAAGLDMKVVSARLRHSTTAITRDLYTSILPDVAREAAEKTAAMVPRRAVGEVPSPTGRVPNGSPRSRRTDWFSGGSANGQVKPL